MTFGCSLAGLCCELTQKKLHKPTRTSVSALLFRTISASPYNAHVQKQWSLGSKAPLVDFHARVSLVFPAYLLLNIYTYKDGNNIIL